MYDCMYVSVLQKKRKDMAHKKPHDWVNNPSCRLSRVQCKKNETKRNFG